MNRIMLLSTSTDAWRKPACITLAEIGRNQAEFFTIYRIDTDTDGNMELRVGSTSGSVDGSTNAPRTIVLSVSNRSAKTL